MLCILWDRAIYMWIFYEIICKRVNQCNYALKEKKICDFDLATQTQLDEIVFIPG